MDNAKALEIAKDRNATYSDILSYSVSAPTVDPVKRKKGSKYPEYQFHRFPLKNGITKLNVMADSIQNNNSLLARIKATSELPIGETISIELDNL